MISYFVMPRRAANAASLAMLLVATGLLVMHHDEGTALRFMLSLALCIVIVNVNASVLDSVHRRMLSQSLTDPLTGAFTRRHMETCVQQTLERHRRTAGAASILVIDVDRFEAVNERFGHEAGDQGLRALAALLTARARKLDLLFRMDGGKFLLLVPDTRAPQALKLAEYLRAAAAQTPLIEGRSLEVSIGVSEVRPGDDTDNWLERANGALSRAKDEGRNRVRGA
jgi:diguanylate cyclase (GGDEF)-like protein